MNEECSCEDTPKKKSNVEVMPEIDDGAQDDRTSKKNKKYLVKAIKSQSGD